MSIYQLENGMVIDSLYRARESKLMPEIETEEAHCCE